MCSQSFGNTTMASLRRTHQAYEKENSNNAWKAFDTSSEAGRLLRQIYGNKNPPVNVPLPRRSGKSKVPTDAWRPGGGSAAAVDPRRATRDLAKERTVATVRRARPDRSYSRIDFVERKHGRWNLELDVPIEEMCQPSVRSQREVGIKTQMLT